MHNESCYAESCYAESCYAESCYTESCATESCYAESCYAESCYVESCAMSQPLTVTHRGGQLAYPTWAAHTHTTCRELLVDGACRYEGSRQADQGLRGLMLYISYVGIGAPKAPQQSGDKELAERVLIAHAPLACPTPSPEHTDGLQGNPPTGPNTRIQ